jgi:hypothetical protein
MQVLVLGPTSRKAGGTGDLRVSGRNSRRAAASLEAGSEVSPISRIFARCRRAILPMHAFGGAGAGGAFHGRRRRGDRDRSSLVRRQDGRSLLGGTAYGGGLFGPADGGLCRGGSMKGGSGHGKKRDQGQCSVFHRCFLSSDAASTLTSTDTTFERGAWKTIFRAPLPAPMPAGRRGMEATKTRRLKPVTTKSPGRCRGFEFAGEREISTSQPPGRYPS